MRRARFSLNGSSEENFWDEIRVGVSFSVTDDILNDGEILQLSTFYGVNDLIAKLKITRKKAADESLRLETWKKEKIDSLVFLESNKDTWESSVYKVLLDEKFDLIADVISEDEENVKVEKCSNTVTVTMKMVGKKL